MNVYVNKFTARYCFSKSSIIDIVSFVKVSFFHHNILSRIW